MQCRPRATIMPHRLLFRIKWKSVLDNVLRLSHDLKSASDPHFISLVSFLKCRLHNIQLSSSILVMSFSRGRPRPTPAYLPKLFDVYLRLRLGSSMNVARSLWTFAMPGSHPNSRSIPW